MKTKTTLILVFISIHLATYSQSLVIDNGVANAYQVSFPATFSAGSPPSGMTFTFKAINTNSGASTLKLNSFSPITIRKNYDQALQANDIKANAFVTVIFDGTYWQMLSASSNPTSGGQWTTNGSNIYYNTGAVGIGTASPTTDLHVYGSGLYLGSASNNFTFDLGTLSINNQILNSSGTKGYRFLGYGDAYVTPNLQNDLRLAYYNGIVPTNILNIDKSGKIGIGMASFTTEPLNTLDVNGSVAIGSYAGASAAPGNGLIVSGSVGIGNTAPTTNLHVTGGARIEALSSVGSNLVQADLNGNLSTASLSSYGIITGSGSTNRIPYFASSSALLTSSNFLFDGSSMAIGGASLSSNYIFQAQQASTTYPAIYGLSSVATGTAIWGYNNNVTAGSIGVTGVATGAGTGVKGSGAGTGYGVYGTNSGAGPGAYFDNTGSGPSLVMPTGNVGIGLTSPQSLLHLANANGPNVKYQRSAAASNIGDVLGAFDFMDSQNGVSAQANIIVKRDVPSSGASDLPTSIEFNVTKDGTTTMNTAMKIDNSGNVGIGTLAPTTNTRLAIKDGHLQSQQTTAPTAAPQAGAGTSATCTLSNATDVGGVINLTTGSASYAAGAQCTITFNKTYTTAPIIMLTPANAISGQQFSAKQVYATSTVSTFIINFNAAASLSQAYTFFYQVIETQ